MTRLSWFMWLCLFVVVNSQDAEGSQSEEIIEKQEQVSTVFFPLKTSYVAGEEVELIFVIANHGQKHIFLSVDTAEQVDTFDLFPEIFDEMGKQLRSDPIQEPPPPPSSHYMVKDGQRIYVTPYISISPKSIIIMRIADITTYYKSHIFDGIYRLEFPAGIEIIYEAKSIIKREEYPRVSWIEPESIVKRARSPIDSIEINVVNQSEFEISESLEDKTKDFVFTPYMICSGILLFFCIGLILYIIRAENLRKKI